MPETPDWQEINKHAEDFACLLLDQLGKDSEPYKAVQAIAEKSRLNAMDENRRWGVYSPSLKTWQQRWFASKVNAEEVASELNSNPRGDMVVLPIPDFAAESDEKRDHLIRAAISVCGEFSCRPEWLKGYNDESVELWDAVQAYQAGL